jgi:hypothetical protein
MVDQSPVSRTETGALLVDADDALAELDAAPALDAPAELGALAGFDAAAEFEAPAELLDAAGLLELEQDEITSANAANGNNHLSFMNASRLLWLPAVIGGGQALKNINQ